MFSGDDDFRNALLPLFHEFCLPNAVQSVVSISLLAFSKSAWTYFQMARFLTFTGSGFLDHFRVRVHVNPL